MRTVSKEKVVRSLFMSDCPPASQIVQVLKYIRRPRTCDRTISIAPAILRAGSFFEGNLKTYNRARKRTLNSGNSGLFLQNPHEDPTLLRIWILFIMHRQSVQ